MRAWRLCLLGLALCACSGGARPRAEPEPVAATPVATAPAPSPPPAAAPAPELEPVAEELPLPEDFASDAQRRITAANYRAELAALEKELAAQN